MEDYAVGAKDVFGKSRWYVLANSGSRYLLLMEDVLNARPYHKADESVTWEKSSLRAWLNHGYYNFEFTQAEKAAIVKLPLRPEKNNAWETEAGNPTEDCVFCLGFREFSKYMPPNTQHMWWLRTPGVSANEAAIVHPTGRVESRPVQSSTIYVRPAIWVDSSQIKA